MLKSKSPYEINEYFATDFSEDYEQFEEFKMNRQVLEFLNDSFMDIDIEFDGAEEMNKKVLETLSKAISMCKDE